MPRKNSKAIVVRVTPEIYDSVKREADAENITITEKARRYLTKAIEKQIPNS